MTVSIDCLRVADSPRLTGENSEHTRALAESEVVLPPIIVERWQTKLLTKDLGEKQVLEVYADEVRRVCQKGGYQLIDVVQLHVDATDAEWEVKAKATREKFLDEHTHAHSRRGRGQILC